MTTAFRSITRLVLSAAVFCLLAPLAQAQDYPRKPVRIIVPYNPGGAPDIIARLMAPDLTSLLGQSVIIENKPGAGGVVGVTDLLNSPADGYTVLAADLSHWGIYPAMNKDAPYDPLRDFAPVALIFTTENIFVVRSDLPAKDMREFISLARATPGMAYGSNGVGGFTHLAIESLASKLGLKFTHIPHKGSGATVEAMLRGDVAFTVTSVGSLGQNLAAGKVKVLGIAGSNGSKRLPDVPTIEKIIGMPYDFRGTSGWVARAGTSKQILDKLSATVTKVVQSPEISKKFVSLGFEPTPSTPDELAAMIRNDVKTLGEAVRVSGASTTK